MSYRVLKVFDINQAKRKPIGGVKGAVLEDDEGKKFLQLKIKNNSPNFLDRVPILIDCYDSEGVYLGTQGYTYENIFVRKGDMFGTGEAIPLAFPDVGLVSIWKKKKEGDEEDSGLKSGLSWLWIPGALLGGWILQMIPVGIQIIGLNWRH